MPHPPAEVAWLGHATVRIELDGVTLLTDPLLVDRLGPLRRYAPSPPPASTEGMDVVLVSHLHRDHFDLPSLRTLGHAYTLVVPRGAAGYARRSDAGDIRELAVGETTTVGPLTIEATHADHGGFRFPFGPRAVAIGYVVHGTRRLYFAGDTAFHPAMDALRPLDLAILPVGGWGPTLRGGHLDPHHAAEALRLLEPHVALPIHYGTFWPIGFRWLRRSRFDRPGAEFAEQAALMAPSVRIALLPPATGQLIEV